MKLNGKVIKCGDNVDTDVIIPARYLNVSDERELAAHCMEDLVPDFCSRAQSGAVLVAGKNFGCGSSREHAPLAIKASGIAFVIAEDFARIFYRNAVNIGLPIYECAEASHRCGDGDMLELDRESGVIRNVTRGESYRATPFPAFIQDIIDAGGLMNTVNKKKEGHSG